MLGSNESLCKAIACATVLFGLISCSGGGSSGGSTSAPPPATLTITSPSQGASSVPVGPVVVTFAIQNSPVGPSTDHPRMHFHVDGDSTVYKFYDGPGIVEDGSLSGVRYQGAHTHFVHWKSVGSIQLNALPSGPHTIKFVLVDQNETELSATETTLSFTIVAGTGGIFSLQEVVGGLKFPSAMATVSDGRIFVNELVAGTIRVVTPTTTLPWRLQATPFATLPVVPPGGVERGLLGIAVDPNFDANGFVYVYYTEADPNTASGAKNRVVRLTATTDSNGNTVATSSPPFVILDNIPAADVQHGHNGGIIQFGPDGMLYIFVGENEVAADAQVPTSLRGKILRVDPTDGSAPDDNPFISNPDPNAQIVYSLGHRNSFGFTFHSKTNDLWETENGPTANDEVNRILAGKNYGWDQNLISGNRNDLTFIDPIFSSGVTRFAPTGIVSFREDSVYPAEYHNNLLFADFNFGQLHRIELGAVPNLITAYGMNEGSGTTLDDASGSGHTGTLVNGPTRVASQTTYGQALSFDGVDDAVSVANPGGYNFGTADFTLETWVKRDVLGGGQRHLFSTCTVATWGPGCKEFYFNANNQLTFGSKSTGDTLSSTIADTAWHHIAVTFTKSTQTMQFYVDGALATTALKPLEADNPGHIVTIGNLLGDNSFSGLLDDFRIYSRALTLAEIQADSATPFTPSAQQLTSLSRHSIACDCGQGGLIAVMHGLNVPGQDGYVYVTNGNFLVPTHSIFRVVLNNP